MKLMGFAGGTMMGGDVVEVSPAYNTAVSGAHVAMELCGLALWNKGKK